MASSSSPTSPTDPSPPFAVPLLLPPPPPSQPPSSSRRLPPPCWSPEETAALIDAYRDKWYSLGRSNLKATHWQEVADAVSAACPNASPPKTAVQCRHKMEKLRKRYRAEIQRARNLPVKKFNSSWVHFKLMDSMEKGPSPPKSENNDDIADEDDNDNDEDQDLDLYHASSLNKLRGNGIGSSGGGGGGGDGGNRRGEGGFRIRIPSAVSIAKPGSRYHGKFSDEKRNPNFGSGNGSGGYGAKGVKEGSGLGKRDREREREKERDPVEEMVCAIKVLADGFVKTEQMKMEMAREIESMRMEMEMKRTEMILESQQRIVEAFAKAVSEQKKKTKRMASSSES